MRVPAVITRLIKRWAIAMAIVSLSACVSVADKQPMQSSEAPSQESAVESQALDETGDERDPFEGVNRAIFSFNEGADRYVLKPVAQAYRYVTPDLVDQGVTNVFNNLGDVSTFANSILQGKFHNAVVALNRVIYNTTFGILGLFDVATNFGLEADDEDFGQTLAAWGYDDSAYLMLPLLGPSTVRDLAGLAVDSTVFEALDYIDEVNADERIMLSALNAIDKRADLIPAEGFLSGADKYSLLRDFYLQNRQFKIKDGAVEDEFADDDFEELEGF